MQIYQPFSPFQTLWSHRRLVVRLAWRKVEERYRGSVLGLVWALLHPLLMLAVYTFIFSIVFKARWNLPGGGEAEFAIFLFSGLLLYSIFAECVNEAPNLMAANQTYIKQIVFPIEVLPWVSLLAALFNFTVGLMMLIGFHLFIMGVPPITALYLPLVMVPLLLLTLGVVWLLASLGVFLKDVSQAVGIFTMALLFLSPIFYSPSRIPEAFRAYYYLNPMASLLEMSKASLFYGTSPDWQLLAGVTAACWGVAWLGYLWFMKTKESFADVL